MKKLFYLFYFLLLTIACITQKPEKQEIKYINEVVVKAKNANKLLVMVFGASDDDNYVRLKRDIFDNENYIPFLNNNFIIVSVLPYDQVYKSLWNYFNLEYQSTVIILDQNGNEIERTVGYDGNRDAYMDFLNDVSSGKNLYCVVLTTYKKDTVNVFNNYLMAKKLQLRYQFKDAIEHYNNTIINDPYNKFGFKQECTAKIAECRLMLTKQLLTQNIAGFKK